MAPWPHWSHKWVSALTSRLVPLRLCQLKHLRLSLSADGDALPSQLYSTCTQLNCAKGDVATAEEAQFALWVADDPVRGIMHAGAVLDSKVINNVSSFSVRTEYSGKSKHNANFLV